MPSEDPVFKAWQDSPTPPPTPPPPIWLLLWLWAIMSSVLAYNLNFRSRRAYLVHSQSKPHKPRRKFSVYKIVLSYDTVRQTGTTWKTCASQRGLIHMFYNRCSLSRRNTLLKVFVWQIAFTIPRFMADAICHFLRDYLLAWSALWLNLIFLLSHRCIRKSDIL